MSREVYHRFGGAPAAEELTKMGLDKYEPRTDRKNVRKVTVSLSWKLCLSLEPVSGGAEEQQAQKPRASAAGAVARRGWWERSTTSPKAAGRGRR